MKPASYRARVHTFEYQSEPLGLIGYRRRVTRSIRVRVGSPSNGHFMFPQRHGVPGTQLPGTPWRVSIRRSSPLTIYLRMSGKNNRQGNSLKMADRSMTMPVLSLRVTVFVT